MGDISEFYDEQWGDEDASWDEYLVELLEEKIWTTARGQEVKIRDMSLQHIRNTIKWLEDGKANHDGYLLYIPILKEEEFRRTK